ncbi:MAG: DUF2752 domain-containing protein [Bacteroidota bacterium]
MDIASWIESFFLTCSFKEVSGIDCLGCGLQRSLVSILRGDLYGSVRYYPPLIFLIIYFLLLTVYLTTNTIISSELLRKSTYSLLTIVLLSYIYKGIFFGLAH